jgi:PPP family 3-phenylpropionic acid transporter
MMSLTAPRYPTNPLPSKRVAVFYGTYFAVLGVVLPMLGPWLEGRGVEPVGIGLVTAAFSLAKLVYTPVVAHRVDRGGWRPGLLTVHLILAAGVAAALPAFDSTASLVLAFLVIGAGHGTVLPLVEAMVLERVRDHGYGRLRLWGSVGFVAVATGLPVVWRESAGSGFPLALAVVLAVLTLATVPFEREVRPEGHDDHGRVPGSVWALLVVLTLHQVSHGPYYAFFSVRLVESGFSASAVGVLWSLGVVAELVAFRAGGAIERRLGLRGVLSLALALTPVRWMLLALEPSWPLLVVAQSGHALTFALAHLAGVQLVSREVPPGARRRAQALYSGLSFGLGIVVGSAVAGPVWQALGAGTFIVAAAGSVVVAIAWAGVAPRLDRVRR